MNLIHVFFFFVKVHGLEFDQYEHAIHDVYPVASHIYNYVPFDSFYRIPQV